MFMSECMCVCACTVCGADLRMATMCGEDQCIDTVCIERSCMSHYVRCISIYVHCVVHGNDMEQISIRRLNWGRSAFGD